MRLAPGVSKITLLALSLAVVTFAPFASAASTLALDLTDPQDDVYTATMSSRGSIATPTYDRAEGHPNIDLVGAWSQPSGEYLMLGLKVLGAIEQRNTATGDQSGMAGTQYLYSFALELDHESGADLKVEYTGGEARIVREDQYKDGSMSSAEKVRARAAGDVLLVDLPMSYADGAPAFDLTVAAVEHQSSYSKSQFETTIFVDILGEFPDYPELYTSSEDDDTSVFEAPAPTFALAVLAGLGLAAVARRR